MWIQLGRLNDITMKEYKSKFWQLDLPDAWAVDEDDEIACFYMDEGFGELQISASKLDEQVTQDTLLSMAAEHLEAGAEPEQVQCGAFSGITVYYEFEGEFWQEWYLMSGTLMLFVTYVCDLDDEGKEVDMVEVILSSLKPSVLH